MFRIVNMKKNYNRATRMLISEFVEILQRCQVHKLYIYCCLFALSRCIFCITIKKLLGPISLKMTIMSLMAYHCIPTKNYSNFIDTI